MPVAPDVSFAWTEAALLFVAVVVSAFLVTWLVTDVAHVRRTPYIAILAVVALGLTAWDMAWSGTSIAEMVTPNWPWAIVAGLAVSAITALGLRRMAPAEPRADEGLVVPFVWEGVIYGIAEALLLAVLPVLAAWQAAYALGWTDGAVTEIGAGALATVASLFVILVHHLGYREFRERATRPALVGALFGCALQALAFLLTGNVLAPVLAHIVLHWQVVLRGMELPPSERDTASAEAAPERPLVPVGR